MPIKKFEENEYFRSPISNEIINGFEKIKDKQINNIKN